MTTNPSMFQDKAGTAEVGGGQSTESKIQIHHSDFTTMLTLQKQSSGFKKKKKKKRQQVNGKQRTAYDPLDAVDVTVGVEEDAVRDLSIPAGSARLLVVTLH